MMNQANRHSGDMSIEAQILATLQRVQPLSNSAPTYQLEQLQPHVYRLEQGQHTWFVKWIPEDDPRGQNEITINQSILPHCNLAVPRLLFVYHAEPARIAGWEWLKGSDLRTTQRTRLPEAFANLGRFHEQQRHQGPVYSPTTHQAYPSVRDLLAAEVTHLCPASEPALQAACARRLAVLEHGYSTVIHGDLHPGNLRLTEQALFFVDWGYALPSLNFFDLDYVQSVALGGEEDEAWWHIHPRESAAVLAAYFQACGLAHLNGRQTHLAVMLWNELRNYNAALQREDDRGAALCRQNITLLLQQSG